MAKEITREQADRKKAQAASFMERIGQSDRAQEFENMSTEEYAEHKGLRLSNPRVMKRRMAMATTSTPSKLELEEQIDQAIDVLDGAYAPESTREELAEAVGEALDILRGEEEDEMEEDEDDSLD